MGTGNWILGHLWCTGIPSRGSRNTPGLFMLRKPGWAPASWATWFVCTCLSNSLWPFFFDWVNIAIVFQAEFSTSKRYLRQAVECLTQCVQIGLKHGFKVSMFCCITPFSPKALSSTTNNNHKHDGSFYFSFYFRANPLRLLTLKKSCVRSSLVYLIKLSRLEPHRLSSFHIITLPRTGDEN